AKEAIEAIENALKTLENVEFTETLIDDAQPLPTMDYNYLKKKILQQAKENLENDNAKPYMFRQIVSGLTAHLPLEDRGRFIRQLLAINDYKSLVANIDKVLAQVKETEERNYIMKTSAAVDRLLKMKIYTKSGNTKKAKYGVDIQKLLQEAQNIWKMSKAQARELYEKTMQSMRDENGNIQYNFSAADKFKNTVLQIKAFGLSQQNPKTIKSLYDDLRELMTDGRAKRENSLASKIDRREQAVAELQALLHKRIEEDKPLTKAEQAYLFTTANWEDALNTVFNAKIKEVYSLLLSESNKDTQNWKDTDKLKKRFMEIYGIKSESKINDELAELRRTKYKLRDRGADAAVAGGFVQRTIEKIKSLLPKNEYYKNPDKDVVLPDLNAEDLELLGKKNKKVLLKKNIVEKEKANHKELAIDDYNDIISNALYNADEIIRDKPKDKPNYYLFVKKDVINGKNVSIVIELAENKENYEVVGWQILGNDTLDKKIKRANREGGQVLITKRNNSQGAAALSALAVSNNNIPQSSAKVNITKEIDAAQIMTIYNWYKDPQLRERLIEQYGQYQLDDMFKLLDAKDRKFADALQEIQKGFRDKIAEVFFNETGLEFANNPNYFQSVTMRVTGEMFQSAKKRVWGDYNRT
ncbi:MAG: hypothetical protein LBQ47_08970, partial [Endomicrobium sp.]|nr:hypothetical protein [Endomicrobium sp.]